jgi:hypothetical protein
VIEATVGELPTALMADHKFGLDFRGMGADGEIHDEPDDDDPVLTARLKVDASLEPRWLVVNDRLPEDKVIPASDRSLLGVSRLGVNLMCTSHGAAAVRLRR